MKSFYLHGALGTLIFLCATAVAWGQALDALSLGEDGTLTLITLTNRSYTIEESKDLTVWTGFSGSIEGNGSNRRWHLQLGTSSQGFFRRWITSVHGMSGGFTDAPRYPCYLIFTNGTRFVSLAQTNQNGPSSSASLEGGIVLGTNGTSAVFRFGTNGLPESAYCAGCVFLFANWSTNTFDLALVNTNGQSLILRQVPFDEVQMSNLMRISVDSSFLRLAGQAQMGSSSDPASCRQLGEAMFKAGEITILGSAMGGALAGTVFGPYGVVIGGVTGGMVAMMTLGGDLLTQGKSLWTYGCDEFSDSIPYRERQDRAPGPSGSTPIADMVSNSETGQAQEQGLAASQAGAIEKARTDLKTRLSVSRFEINDGEVSTANRLVTLNSLCNGVPSQFLASESANFVGANWLPYVSAPSFILTEGSGTKTVFFKVRNAAGESTVVTDTIALTPPQHEVTLGRWLVTGDPYGDTEFLLSTNNTGALVAWKKTGVYFGQPASCLAEHSGNLLILAWYDAPVYDEFYRWELRVLSKERMEGKAIYRFSLDLVTREFPLTCTLAPPGP